MLNTARYGIPYAEDGDSPNGPDQEQALAEAIEAAVDEPLHPCAAVYRPTNQSIPNSVWTPVSYVTERFDTDGLWGAGTPTKFIAVTAGIYMAAGFMSFAGNSTGARAARIVKYGGGGGSPTEGLGELSVDGRASPGGGAGGNALNIQSRPFELDVGEAISFDVFQNITSPAGGALNLMGDVLHTAEFGIAFQRGLP